MNTHSFTLQVAGLDHADCAERLFEAGCDDALVSILDGRVFMDFDREAPSYDRAVRDAIEMVKRAGGSVIEATPLGKSAIERATPLARRQIG